VINTDCIGICKSNYHNGHVVNGKFAKMKKRNKIKKIFRKIFFIL
jgi:hypothetical protein